MKPVNNDWTPILTSRLRALFDEGLSFSHIASELAMSRNAVLGKCNRLGLVRIKFKPKPAAFRRRPRSDPSKNKKLHKILAGPPAQSESLPSTPDAELWSKHDLNIPKRRRKNIWTLGPKDCKFPIGTPGASDFFFCGAKSVEGLPYCEPHSRRCFHPAKRT